MGALVPSRSAAPLAASIYRLGAPRLAAPWTAQSNNSRNKHATARIRIALRAVRNRRLCLGSLHVRSMPVEGASGRFPQDDRYQHALARAQIRGLLVLRWSPCTDCMPKLDDIIGMMMISVSVPWKGSHQRSSSISPSEPPSRAKPHCAPPQQQVRSRSPATSALPRGRRVALLSLHLQLRFSISSGYQVDLFLP